MYQGKVSRAVMEIPRMQQAYFERIGDLVNDLFDVERLHNRIDRTAEVIRRDLVLNDPAEIPDYLEEVSELKERVARRYETLRRELDGPAKVPEFDSAGLVSLTAWDQDQFFGKPKIESVEHEGRRSLMLSTVAGTSVGRWKTSVWLEAGDYELVGKMKFSGIEAGRGDPRGGVAMWSSVRRIRERQTGSEDWTERQVRFSVRQPIQEVQLFCEYRATEGTAWFDAESLKLRHLVPSDSK